VANLSKLPSILRDLIFWLMYEPRSKRSDDAFREIAAKFGVSEQSVRQAVTKFRKPPKAVRVVEML
jgi:DNA-binding Lrp family transcriptional regulator